jgi:hypothetical protein
MLWRNHLIVFMALLGGFAPAAMASPGCNCVVLPVRNRGEISRLGNAETSQCAPAPMGAELAQGGRSSLGKKISPEQKNKKTGTRIPARSHGLLPDKKTGIIFLFIIITTYS